MLTLIGFILFIGGVIASFISPSIWTFLAITVGLLILILRASAGSGRGGSSFDLDIGDFFDGGSD